jgi:thioredoxin-like negative regulator of GroEL
MRFFFFVLLFGAFPLLGQQTSFSRLSIDQAKKIAEDHGAFIIVDFYADWCGPCREMDEKVWSLPEVQEAQKRFVNVRVDASVSTSELQRWGIRVLPSLVVIDATGIQYFQKSGYLGKREVLGIMEDFPKTSISELYAAHKSTKMQNGFAAKLRLAMAYQDASRKSNGGVAIKMGAESNRMIKQAQKALPKGASPQLVNRLELMEAENLLLKGNAKKAIKAVTALGTDLEEKNDALACFILSLAYRETGQSDRANECYDRLQRMKDNEEYLALYAAQFKE